MVDKTAVKVVLKPTNITGGARTGHPWCQKDANTSTLIGFWKPPFNRPGHWRLVPVDDDMIWYVHKTEIYDHIRKYSIVLFFHQNCGLLSAFGWLVWRISWEVHLRMVIPPFPPDFGICSVALAEVLAWRQVGCHGHEQSTEQGVEWKDAKSKKDDERWDIVRHHGTSPRKYTRHKTTVIIEYLQFSFF